MWRSEYTAAHLKLVASVNIMGSCGRWHILYIKVIPSVNSLAGSVRPTKSPCTWVTYTKTSTAHLYSNNYIHKDIQISHTKITLMLQVNTATRSRIPYLEDHESCTYFLLWTKSCTFQHIMYQSEQSLSLANHLSDFDISGVS